MRLVRYQVDIAGLPGGPGISTLHWDTDDGPVTDNQITEGVRVFWNSIKAYLTSAITLNGRTYVDVLDEATGEITSQAPATGFVVACTNAGTALSPTTQMLVQWRTGVYVGGRQIRGKTFIPGMCEDSNEAGGVPQTAVRTVVFNAAGTLGSSVPGLGVYSRTHFQFAPVSSHATWDKWAVLRGRRDA